MKVSLWFMLVVLAVAQALVPHQIINEKEKLFPKTTLKEWQEILVKAKYVPSNTQVRGISPQPASSGRALNPQIFGGNTASEGQFPWQVSLDIDYSHFFCGGSLISPDWVLTAGHCIGNIFLIRAGSLHPNYGGQSTYSTNGIRHRDYNNNNNFDNDIGLIQISGISFNTNVISVLLPRRDIGDLVGKTCRVSGWGLTSDSSSSLSSVLKFVDLNIVDVSVCLNTYGQYLPDKTICIDSSHGKSICNGDNGGALIHQEKNGYWAQVGIVSLASPYSCQDGLPNVFTRVSAHLDWIAHITDLRV